MKIAIIGCSGYFPGASTIRDFTKNIYGGIDVRSNLSSRYQANDLKSNPELLKLSAALLNDIYGFDAKFFAMKEREALRLSAQQRLLLEATYHVFSDANYNLGSIKNRPIGFFIGAVNDDYLEQMDVTSQDMDAFFHMGSDISMLAGRVSAYFKLTGPAQVICSACSSGAVAIHQACQSLFCGDSEMAIAGGIYTISLQRLMMHHHLGTLSRQGRCAPFSNEADGLIFGEGVGLVLLKPYELALKDNDTVYAVIEATGVNHEGGSGPTAQPTVQSQYALIKKIYDKYHINPEEIAYVEAHGTGTRVGDLVEFQALNAAFSDYTNKKQYCILGTSKANLGHTVSASAAISLIKLIHVLRSKFAPPSINFKNPRKEINFIDSPFKIVTQAEPLMISKDQNILGAINSFGYVGTNAHIVISVPTDRKKVLSKITNKNEEYLFYFSAKDYTSLGNYLGRFLESLADGSDSLHSLSAALLLQDHFKKKVFMIAQTKFELESKLKKLLSDMSEQTDENMIQFLQEHNEKEIRGISNSRLKEFTYRTLLGFKSEDLYPIDKIKEEKVAHLPEYPFHHVQYQLGSKIDKKIIESPEIPVIKESTVNYDEIIRDLFAKLIEVSPEKINGQIPFSEMGLDSIQGIQLINDINTSLAINLSPTVIYDYTSLNDLTSYINKTYGNTSEIKQESLISDESSNLSNHSTEYTDEDIAIIGISCRFPKSKDYHQFFNNLVNGVSAIDEIPTTRWSINEFYDQDLIKPWKMNTKWGGFLEDYDKFDPAFFNISPKEALEMDPQQRLLLEEFWHAIEDAGYAPNKMPTDKIGTFTAAAHGDYVRNAVRADYAPTGHLFVGNNLAILAARLAYILDFKGPALNVDTACSTSLVATHLACNSLIRGECKMALVGAANVFSTEFNFLYYTKSGMLSPDGKCKVFDNDANGFVPGEGVAAILLKPVKDAIKDNDHIYAIIKASGINQDGKTNGITAPSEKSQTDLQVELFQKTNISPSTIGYVETHGTGTKLGDPIEVEALTHSFRQFTGEKQYCYIGSVKSNLGHTIMTAGLAGLVKATLAVYQKIIPPTLHIKTPNKFIDFTNSPFKLSLEQHTWTQESNQPRRAFVNSFGMSGTNAQVLLEEFPQQQKTNSQQDHELILLSAVDQQVLKEQAKQLRDHLHLNPTINLSDLAFTLQVGRKHLPEKIAIIANSIENLVKLLDDFLLEKQSIDLLFASKNPNRLKENLNKTDSEKIKQLLSVTEDWFQNKEINWSSLYQEKPSRISLPGYPFKRIRYWIQAPEEKRVIATVKNQPSQESDKLVQQFIGETLAIDPTQANPDQSLIDLGMDSILGLTLQAKLESQFSIRIPTKDMFEHLTVNKLKKYIKELLTTFASQSEQDTWTLGVEGNVTPDFLKQEAVLPIKLASYNARVEMKKYPDNYLVTGSTGFLGAYLLGMLFAHTQANIYCLIRKVTQEQGLNKIKTNLQRYGLWKSDYAHRLTIISGDLEEENFGLAKESYQELSEKIDCICHAGAKVNHILSYHDLKKANVNGTIEVIKFAATTKLKPIHYISTIGTIIRRILETGKTEVYAKEATTQDAVGLEVGYSQSKWVAEQMLWQAQEQGLPVTIYRAGEITGAASKPQCRTDDMFHMLVKCFSELDCYPKTWPQGVVDIIPIDYVTRSIVGIMHANYQHRGFYHFVHPQQCSALKVFDWLNKHVKSMKAIDFEEWRNRCIQYIESDNTNKRNLVLKQIFRNTPFGYRFTWYFKDYGIDIIESQKALQKLGISCPPLDENLFNNIFRFIIEAEKIKG